MSNSVPEGWVESSLGNIADIRFSNVDKKSDFENEEPVKLCNYMDVYSNSKITNSLPFMQATAKDREIKKFSLLKNDVIITKDSETPDDIAVSAYVSEDLKSVVCGYHLAMLRPEQSLISGEYLNHLFGLDDIQHYFYLLANGITRFGLTTDAINNAYIIYPPLPEQKKIAAILTSVDTVIEKTQAQIDKLKDLKTGMMQELLTKGIGHTEFKDSPVGRIPVEWEIHQQGDKADFSNGRAYKLSEWEKEGTPVIRLQNLTGSGKDYYYSNLELPERQYCKNGDLLYMWSATFGPHIWKGSKAIYHYHIWKVTPDETTLTKSYLYYLLDYKTKQWKDESSNGMGILHVTKSAMESMLIAIPPIKEQQYISKTLEAIDKRINLSEEKFQLLKNTKKALMQDLLTGKVRVKV